ncbi:C40 family peptidase [Streptacidiphilus carbonis]|uniref:C40 family peptidase n=1 Tax=Streptacidiphilus carbonis TaxID=105422 RepID=UPI0006940A75|nr:C40 family peptidase [Streptacidiphilus carbonis]
MTTGTTTGFIELDATTLAPGVCRCSRCTAPAAPPASAAPVLPSRYRPRLRLAATGALVAVGGAVGGTALSLTAASSADALPAPSRPGWDGHRYWFQRNGEWRWTSHYDIYLSATSGSGSASRGTTGPATTTKPGSGGIHQGWDGHRYWFRHNGEWRWTSHYDIYLHYISGTGNPVPPKPPARPKPPAGAASLAAAIAFAQAQLGKPYVWGGNGPNGYDCSGLIQQAFLRVGLRLPRLAVDQYRATRPIAATDLRAGDLLFWSSSSRVSGIHHVALYLGSGRYIEAPRPGKDVRISILSTGYYPTFFGRVTR